MRYGIIALLCLLVTSTAQAHTRHHRHHHPFHHYAHHRHHGVRYAHGSSTSGDRPHAWCGWYMRQIMHVADAAYDLARNWAHWGKETTPHEGAIVVWPHHVGKIVGPCHGSQCVVLSGNDGHRVRTRERSVAGAIAFRESP